MHSTNNTNTSLCDIINKRKGYQEQNTIKLKQKIRKCNIIENRVKHKYKENEKPNYIDMSGYTYTFVRCRRYCRPSPLGRLAT